MPKLLSERELEAMRARYPHPLPLSNEPGRHERHMRLVLQDMNRVLDHVDALEGALNDESSRRDEKLLDALQTARYALTAVDGFDGRTREARLKAALDEALALMRVQTW